MFIYEGNKLNLLLKVFFVFFIMFLRRRLGKKKVIFWFIELIRRNFYIGKIYLFYLI